MGWCWGGGGRGRGWLVKKQHSNSELLRSWQGERQTISLFTVFLPKGGRVAEELPLLSEMSTKMLIPTIWQG